MSLVAYEDSSDESDYEESETPVERASIENINVVNKVKENIGAGVANGHISDDDDDYVHTAEGELKASTFPLTLPRPKAESTIQELVGQLSTTFSALPAPKIVHNQNTVEEDDEFLHKKDNFVSSEIKPPPLAVAKGPVKITIPSMNEFHDVHMEMQEKAKTASDGGGKSKPKGSGLLSLLPKAKSERTFTKSDANSSDDKSNMTSAVPAPSLIPDTVKFRRPAYSTEGVDDDKKPAKKTNLQKKSSAVANIDEDEDEDDKVSKDRNDFFSLASDDDYSLPDVSTNEINMMVAKKAAKMAEVTTKYLKEAENKSAIESEVSNRNQIELDAARKRYQSSQLDSEATQALVGSSAKRRKNNEEINIVDLNSDQVLPNREEWMRTALASSTTYQPTGVLVDEEPAAGTRRKHQITYLAHKAKANEAELQAMWAANRQNRRATQSKYGF